MDPVAWWGAIVSTALAVVQLRQWWSNRVVLDVSLREAGRFVGNKPASLGVELLLLEVVNRFDHPVTVDCITVFARGKVMDSAAIMGWNERLATWELPVRVEPHDRRSFPLPWEAVKALPQLEGLAYIEVQLSTGDVVRSRVFTRYERSIGTLLVK